jgi:hypothetical protein
MPVSFSMNASLAERCLNQSKAIVVCFAHSARLNVRRSSSINPVAPDKKINGYEQTTGQKISRQLLLHCSTSCIPASRPVGRNDRVLIETLRFEFQLASVSANNKLTEVNRAQLGLAESHES